MKKSSLDINKFIELYDQFINIPTWTKEKSKNHKQLEDFLDPFELTQIIVGKSSLNIYCGLTHTFTVIKIPLNTLGKLYKFRGQWVLIKCYRDNRYGNWGNYFNKVFSLPHNFDTNVINKLRTKFKSNFIHK